MIRRIEPDPAAKYPPVTHKAGESPLNFILRHGFTLLCYEGLRIARRFDKKTGACLEEWHAETAYKLAKVIGWYP